VHQQVGDFLEFALIGDVEDVVAAVVKVVAAAADGAYGITEGVLYGYPCVCRNGRYEIVKGIEVSEFSRAAMQATLKELHEERDSIKHLLA